MRPIVSAMVALALAASGCAKLGIDTVQWHPQNDGTNADWQNGVRLRNAFLLGGADPAKPPPQFPLYGVLINAGDKQLQLERITVEGGGSVQLPGPINLPPGQPVGTGEQPLATASGIRGGAVPLTFSFRGAPPFRVTVPVKPRTGHFARLTPSPASPPSPTSAGTAPPSPSPTSTGNGTGTPGSSRSPGMDNP
ncbi:hypothetical protein FE391_12445 [Nonomuraea sp. KC401]|uniref:hypothetical protein n=1 Tax=unclassified Nonomuraea TaxID=2593643 RepID=UPI0010FDA006|nr:MULTISPECIES: hypothetical protein [unclassified Nonomuraea]NBE94691.1 hypothetical protein [Nonomuraea sp. K271]TLF76125.1 hypothetical protein FE391_12445 [Nonomuraea sp. KC401]